MYNKLCCGQLVVRVMPEQQITRHSALTCCHCDRTTAQYRLVATPVRHHKGDPLHLDSPQPAHMNLQTKVPHYMGDGVAVVGVVGVLSTPHTLQDPCNHGFLQQPE